MLLEEKKVVHVLPCNINKSFFVSKIYYFYYDTKLYRELCKKNNDGLFKRFLKAVLDLHIPAHQTHFDSRTIFTWYSFFEAIGEGRFKEKYSEHKFKIPPSFIDDFSLDLGSLAKDLDRKKSILEAPRILIEQAVEHYKCHPELTRDKLLWKIDVQLKWSSCRAASNLISDTLERRHQEIDTDYEKSLYWIAQNLAWDDACAYDYIRLDNLSEGKRVEVRPVLRKIREIILLNLHTWHVKGYERSSYRLCEAIHRELLSSPECLKEYSEKIGKEVYRAECTFALDPSHDLVDTDIIHYATLGHYDPYKKAFIPVSIFTCDDVKKIRDRVCVQLTVLRFLCNNVIGSQMKIIPGFIYIFNPETAEVIDEIDVGAILETDEVAIKLHHF